MPRATTIFGTNSTGAYLTGAVKTSDLSGKRLQNAGVCRIIRAFRQLFEFQISVLLRYIQLIQRRHATNHHRQFLPIRNWPAAVPHWSCALLAGWSLLALTCTCLGASESAPPDPLGSARKAYVEAQAAYKSEPTNTTMAWKFARACFDLSDLVAKNAQRAQLAQEGIAAAEGALSREPKSVQAHYYLGLDLGELARTKTLGALRLVNRMERELKAARELDEHFDYAGPDRSLGMLYRDAPVIGSVGSRSKARQHLQRAIELAPDYPENRLALLESAIKWGDWNEARKQLKALDELWPAAQKTFTGDAWTFSWSDWDARLKACRPKVESHPPK